MAVADYVTIPDDLYTYGDKRTVIQLASDTESESDADAATLAVFSALAEVVVADLESELTGTVPIPPLNSSSVVPDIFKHIIAYRVIHQLFLRRSDSPSPVAEMVARGEKIIQDIVTRRRAVPGVGFATGPQKETYIAGPESDKSRFNDLPFFGPNDRDPSDY